MTVSGIMMMMMTMMMTIRKKMTMIREDDHDVGGSDDNAGGMVLMSGQGVVTLGMLNLSRSRSPGLALLRALAQKGGPKRGASGLTRFGFGYGE